MTMTEQLRPELPLIVSLIQAKVDILKLKADKYAWQFLNQDMQEEINNTYAMVEGYITVLRNEK